VPRTSDTRERILDAGAGLFRRQGYEGTALKEIVIEGGAPWGSLYHFFPGGKEELGALALRRSGERYRRLIEMVFERADDPAHALRQFFDLSAQALEASDFADGCPIATVALEAANTTEALRLVCAEAFDSWLSTLARALRDAGVTPVAANRLALFGLSTFEGAITLSRTIRNTEPLAASAEFVAGVVESALDVVRAKADAQGPTQTHGERDR
jgi:TetR/AcrR family transcriptional repressor of lmrAB and yxaGH operons